MVTNPCDDKNFKMHYAFASDAKFTRQLQVAVLSLIKSSVGLPNIQVVHILDCGIGDDVCQDVILRINDFAKKCLVHCEVYRHTIDMSLFSGFRIWNTSLATYARLLLPKLLPDVRYCVYADSDVLFFSNPCDLVKELIECDVAVLGHKNPTDRMGVNIDEPWFVSHQLPYNRDSYFCAGLIAMDLDKFRAPGALESMFDFLARHTDVVSADQAALNWYFRDDSALASNGWGVFPMECLGYKYEIKAIHYVGGFPWKNCSSWYIFLMFNRMDSIWIAFAKSVLGPDFSSRYVSLTAKVLACFAYVATRLIVTMRIPFPWKKDFIAEASAAMLSHGSLDRARKKLLSELS